MEVSPISPAEARLFSEDSKDSQDSHRVNGKGMGGIPRAVGGNLFL